MKIGIIAPSSRVPAIELGISVELLSSTGFSIEVHPQCQKSHLFYSGGDLERAAAFYDYARRSDLDVIWCARGGYGAVRLLPLLDQMVMQSGIPRKKLLIGSSDATCLLDYVRNRWGWSVLHAPMPGLRNFSVLKKQEWDSLLNWVKGERPVHPWGKTKLKYYYSPTSTNADVLVAPVVGGNLTIITSLIGTSYAMRFQDKIVFLEDVDEALYRIDRLVQQNLLAGTFQGAKAIILGNFLNCQDYPPMGLKSRPRSSNLKRVMKAPKPKELIPTRKTISTDRGLREIFETLGKHLEIPVAYGLPVGHGPEHFSLPLGGRYEMGPKGELALIDWDWLKSRN